ncbi:alpha/beta-hydrolase [Rostrohypoxylon terebratum]|nr:alpha/beta-hydrolase [Rostrohypoxylon terebratum]
MALAVAYLWATRRKNATLQITGICSSANSAATEETVPEKYRPFFVSMEQNAHAPVLDIAAFGRIKAGSEKPLSYPIAIADPSIMPRTYFQACGRDPTRDCTLVMEQTWRDAGVQTRLDVYASIPHVFWALGLSAMGQVKKHETDTRKGLLWLLSRPNKGAL